MKIIQALVIISALIIVGFGFAKMSPISAQTTTTPGTTTTLPNTGEGGAALIK